MVSDEIEFLPLARKVPLGGAELKFDGEISPGDKIWYLRPGLGPKIEQVFASIGPYEPDAEQPTDEWLDDTFRKHNYTSMLIYTVAAPDESKARESAHQLHRAKLQRNRDEADRRFNEAKKQP